MNVFKKIRNIKVRIENSRTSNIWDKNGFYTNKSFFLDELAQWSERLGVGFR